jgi:class 3 adenylate cyclase
VALTDELTTYVKSAFEGRWDTTTGRVVPEPVGIALGNTAVELESATVLYADIDGSTSMVDQQPWHVCAEIYKAFLHCAAKIIRSQGGVITAYDGDRVMAVYIGERKNSRAALTGLKINWAVQQIINPMFAAQYPQNAYRLRQVVGIDTSPLHVARTGVRGDNDLVWIGRAANYAAKLTTLGSAFPTWITEQVYSALADDAKTYHGDSMWEPRIWKTMSDMRIHRSAWRWPI